MTSIKGFRHSGLVCYDINKSLYFYKNLLGFKVIQDFSDNSEYINKILGTKNETFHMIKLRAKDGNILELINYQTQGSKGLKKNIHDSGISHMAFEVDHIDEFYEFLQKNGVTFISEPVLSSEGFAKVCNCLDPDGIRIEIVEIL